MAPETVRTLQECPRPDEPAICLAADIFSLGVLLKALLLIQLSHHHVLHVPQPDGFNDETWCLLLAAL